MLNEILQITSALKLSQSYQIYMMLLSLYFSKQLHLLLSPKLSTADTTVWAITNSRLPPPPNCTILATFSLPTPKITEVSKMIICLEQWLWIRICRLQEVYPSSHLVFFFFLSRLIQTIESETFQIILMLIWEWGEQRWQH